MNKLEDIRIESAREDISIMSLNLWDGKLFPELARFLERCEATQSVEVYCFQEVYSTPTVGENLVHSKGARANLYEELVRVLPDHQGFFFPAHTYLRFEDWEHSPLAYGLAIFVRRKQTIINVGSQLVHGDPQQFDPRKPGTMPRNVAWVTLATKYGHLGVANFHGLWNGQGKTDTPERIAQSRAVNWVIQEQLPVHYMLCGDFNLLPDTKSFRMLATGRRDLIREHKISSTRSGHYTKPEKYADYMLVSTAPEESPIELYPVHFLVGYEQKPVSDHLSLFVRVWLHPRR